MLVLASGCLKKKEEKAETPPAPVSVSVSEKRSIPLRLQAIGNVEASKTVGIKSRVSGTIVKVHITEGQDVREGSLLFSIDPRPFEAALKQAEAALARDRVQHENAKREAARYTELVKLGYVSQEQYEQSRTNAEALEAVVKVDAAAVENAKLLLSYCSIYAPVSGRTGSLLLHEGNLVKENDDTPMLIINRLQPVNVSFSLPERHLQEIRKYMSAGRLSVEAHPSKDEKDGVRGTLDFIDNQVDALTGTIRMKASFPNTDRSLWPGQFVKVVMTLSVIGDATVVPSPAIQTGQQGQYIYVVKGDIAELRPVSAGIEYGGMTVIEKGLAPGEAVVTDGHARVTSGGKVAVKSRDR